MNTYIKSVMLTGILVVSSSVGAATPIDASGAPLQEGSLGNEKLIRDALQGVYARAGMLGCSKIDSWQPYVLAQPQGAPGERMWRERWIISCQGTGHPIDIRFNEAGPGAADWTIE